MNLNSTNATSPNFGAKLYIPKNIGKYIKTIEEAQNYKGVLDVCHSEVPKIRRIPGKDEINLSVKKQKIGLIKRLFMDKAKIEALKNTPTKILVDLERDPRTKIPVSFKNENLRFIHSLADGPQEFAQKFQQFIQKVSDLGEAQAGITASHNQIKKLCK